MCDIVYDMEVCFKSNTIPYSQFAVLTCVIKADCYCMNESVLIIDNIFGESYSLCILKVVSVEFASSKQQ